MATVQDTELTSKMESMIDIHGLYFVVNAIANACSEKCDHLKTNWQDPLTARQWEKAAHILDNAADKIFRQLDI